MRRAVRGFPPARAALFLAGLLACAACSGGPASPAPPAHEARPASSPAGSYPSDFGPGDGVRPGGVSGEALEGFRLFSARCAACHPLARAFYHRYAEPEGRDTPGKEAVVASLKADHPDWFREPLVWQIEAEVWRRCVSRMAAKPGAGVSPREARAIALFLCADSSRRKLGPGAARWKSLRESLLRDFKARHPKRWKELEEADAL